MGIRSTLKVATGVDFSAITEAGRGGRERKDLTEIQQTTSRLGVLVSLPSLVSHSSNPKDSSNTLM